MSTKITDIIENKFSDIILLLHSKEQTQTLLFDLILEQYESMTHEIISETERSPKDQCQKIWAWYYNKYMPNKFPKKQGISRSISRVTTEDTYYFDIPYQEKEFGYNLLTRNRVEAEIIKHICVAFRMDQDACNTCLEAYGYLPLHSKNLHDLAIYSVLATIENISSDDNPLLMVKERYFKGLDLIKRNQSASQSLDTVETQVLTDEIKSAKHFDENQLISYLQKNASYLNWRHSAILEEHRRLIKVFQHLYYDRQKGAFWSSEESKYSLFSFVNQFCKKISYKDFGERLINDIRRDGKKNDRGNKHPTREIMILLWLYEECFRNSLPIFCPSKYTKSIAPGFWEKTNICDENGGARTKFNIHEYLFGETSVQKKVKVNIGRQQCTGNYYFVGADAKQIINDNLEKFGYSRLSSTDSIFDRVIMELLTLRVYHLSQRKDSFFGDSHKMSLYGFDFGGSEPMDISENFKYILDNYFNEQIPISLALIFEILSSASKLKKFNHSTTAEEKAKFLLSCNLSSQI